MRRFRPAWQLRRLLHRRLQGLRVSHYGALLPATLPPGGRGKVKNGGATANRQDEKAQDQHARHLNPLYRNTANKTAPKTNR